MSSSVPPCSSTSWRMWSNVRISQHSRSTCRSTPSNVPRRSAPKRSSSTTTKRPPSRYRTAGGIPWRLSWKGFQSAIASCTGFQFAWLPFRSSRRGCLATGRGRAVEERREGCGLSATTRPARESPPFRRSALSGRSSGTRGRRRRRPASAELPSRFETPGLLRRGGRFVRVVNSAPRNAQSTTVALKVLMRGAAHAAFASAGGNDQVVGARGAAVRLVETPAPPLHEVLGWAIFRRASYSEQNRAISESSAGSSMPPASPSLQTPGAETGAAAGYPTARRGGRWAARAGMDTSNAATAASLTPRLGSRSPPPSTRLRYLENGNSGSRSARSWSSSQRLRSKPPP